MACHYVYSGGDNTGTTSASFDNTKWTTAWQSLADADSNVSAGDTVYVAHDHNKNYAGTTAITIAATCRIVSVNRTTGLYQAATSSGDYTSSGTYTFGSADDVDVLIEGAKLGTTGSYLILPPAASQACFYSFRGCTILANSSTYGVFMPCTDTRIEFSKCVFDHNSASGAMFYPYVAPHVTVNDCTFSNAASKTTLISNAAGGTFAWFNDCDVSQCTTLIYNNDSSGHLELRRCKVNSSVTLVDDSTGNYDVDCVLLNCGSDTDLTTTPTGLSKYERGMAGTIEHDATRGVAATDGSNVYCLKYTTESTCSAIRPLISPVPIAAWHPGGTKTLTVRLGSGDSGLDDSEVFAIINSGDSAATSTYEGERVDTRPDYGSEAAAGTSTYLKTGTTGDWTTSPGTAYEIQASLTTDNPGYVYVSIGVAKYLGATTYLWVDPEIDIA